MSFENPLAHIQRMKAKNEAKIQSEQEEVNKQQASNQENTDKEYSSKQESLEAFSTSVEAFKQRVQEISGTQAEMIKQYRVILNELLVPMLDETEVKKKARLEVLKEVRDNFDNIFAEAKKEWRAIGSEKADNIESMNSGQKKADEVSGDLEKMYSQTTEGKANTEQQKLEQEQEKIQKFKEKFRDLINEISHNPEGVLTAFPHAQENSQLLEDIILSEEEYEKTRTVAIEEAVDEYLEKNHNYINISKNGIDEGYQKEGYNSYSLQEVQERIDYDRNLENKKFLFDQRLSAFGREFEQAKQEYEAMYQNLSEDVRAMLNAFDMRIFAKRMYIFTPDVLNSRNKNSQLDPQSTIAYMDLFKDVVDTIIPCIVEKAQSLLKENESSNEKSSYEIEKEILNSEEMKELDELTIHKDFSYAINFGTKPLEQEMGNNFSAELLRKKVQEGQAEKQALKEKYLEKFNS